MAAWKLDPSKVITAEMRAAEAEASAWAALRRERDTLLQRSDWTQLPDAPCDPTAWAAYRTALRNLPQQTEDATSVEWPTPPVV